MPMASSNPADQPVRVLVIEDNPDDRELLLRQLQKSGMDNHVKFISNGQEALHFLTEPHAPPLAESLIAIFLDLKLPVIGGLELLRHLRSQVELKNMPVIVMTASSDPKDLAECSRLNVTNYVSKPVTFTSFSKAVADVFHLPNRNSAEPV